MPFSDEQRKCPHCGGHEYWSMMAHVNGSFYCQDCYIRLFENEEQKDDGNQSEHT